MSITYYATSPRGQEEPSNRRAINGLRIPVATLPTDEVLVGAILISPNEVTDADPWEFEIRLQEQPPIGVLAHSPVLALTPELASSSKPDHVEFEPLMAVLIVRGHFRRPGPYELTFHINGLKSHSVIIIVEEQVPSRPPRRYSLLAPQ